MDKIDELLQRAVDDVLPSKGELEKVLRSGKKLRVYQGFDPSTPQLHIGHMIGLRKLAQWQDLGHEVIFLIGDFTARIGDPTGKEKTRPILSKTAVEKNAKTYKEQAAKILKLEGANAIKIKFNSQWLGKLSSSEIFELASQVTYQQVIKRDMYKKRIQNDQDISMNEILYPIFQGYDSVAMDVDVEVGGRDQLFNMLMGRDLMHKMKRKNKFVMTTQLLIDAQGNKVGKTTGNATALTDPPEKIYGSVMSFPDDIIIKGFEYLTDVPQTEIKSIQKAIETRKNPLKYKKQLAFEIIIQLDGEKAAKAAQTGFEKAFQKGVGPDSILTIKLKKPSVELIDFLVDNNLAASKSEAKRLIRQKSIEIDGQIVEKDEVEFENNQVMRIGKKKFVRIAIG